METFAKRLKFARERCKLTQDELAELSGVGQGVISKLERGIILKTTGLIALARALDCNPVWLETGMDALGETNGQARKAPLIALESNKDYPAIARVRLTAADSLRGYTAEYLSSEGLPLFSADWYRARNLKPEKIIAANVVGDGMAPNIHDGDLVFVNMERDQPKDAKIYMVVYEGEILVKRLVRDDGRWWLTSDNSDQRRYPRKICDEDTKIIGEVVYLQTEKIY